MMLPILLALAISWGSYADAQHKTPSDNFTAYHAQIWMYGTGFTPNTYHTVRWTDGSGQVVLTEVVKSKGNGSLESYHVVRDTDTPGAWYSRVYLAEVLVAEDSFWVAQSAVPEFPSGLAAFLVAAICGVIYWLIRRKRNENIRCARA